MPALVVPALGTADGTSLSFAVGVGLGCDVAAGTDVDGDWVLLVVGACDGLSLGLPVG